MYKTYYYFLFLKTKNRKYTKSDSKYSFGYTSYF